MKYVADILIEKGSDVIITSPNQSVESLASQLNAQGIGLVIVQADHGSILGVVSERDVVRALAVHREKAAAMRVEKIMTPAVVTVRLDDSIDHAGETMMRHGFRHLLVVDNGRPAGVISIRDVAHAMMKRVHGADEGEANLVAFGA